MALSTLHQEMYAVSFLQKTPQWSGSGGLKATQFLKSSKGSEFCFCFASGTSHCDFLKEQVKQRDISR